MSSEMAPNRSQDKDRNADQTTIFGEEKEMQRNDFSNQGQDVATARPAVSAAVKENVDGTFEERTDEQDKKFCQKLFMLIQYNNAFQHFFSQKCVDCETCKKIRSVLNHKKQCVIRGCHQCQDVKTVELFHTTACTIRETKVGSCVFCLVIDGIGGEEHAESCTVQASVNAVYETIIYEFTQITATSVKGIQFVNGKDYKLGKSLGKGGNGEVFEVELLARGKKKLGMQADNLLAVKIANVRGQERLVLKTLVLANCPHSATHYFIVHKPQQICRWNKKTHQDEPKDFEHLMFMKRAETSLLSYRDSLPGRVLAVKEACYYSRQLLESILYAHKLDPPIVHNDLKCSNVLLYHDGERYSADLTDYEYATTGDVRSRGGTPFFMAPKALGETADPADDIFSFGVMFLEMTIPKAIPTTSDRSTWPEFRAAKVQELKNKNMALGLLIEACFLKHSKKRSTAEYLLKRINEIGVEAKWWPETSTCTRLVSL